jgi:DNA-binding FadR family transcriptional regulator
MTDPGLPEDLTETVDAPHGFEGIVARLGGAISVGRLAPGTKLPPEREMAPQLGVSRWTLRKAIVALTETGHLESRKGRNGGSFVAADPPLRPGGHGELPTDVREVLDMRMVLEVGTVALAAKRAGTDELLLLEQLVADMETAAGWEDYRRTDVRFHVVLAEATRSSRVLTATTAVQAELSTVLGAVAHPAAVLRHANEEHRELVEAMRGRDIDEAVRIIQRHLAGTEQIVSSL